MAKIGIVGSGNVGANTAFFLAENGVGDVMLYDLVDGLSKGKALDMMEAAPVRGYQTRIFGSDSIEDLLDSDLLMIAAGAVRKPGMEREELFAENKKLIAELAKSLSSFEGNIVIITEPVDPLTTLFIRESSLPNARIMGLGGFLDSTRLQYLIAQELGVATENVTALIIGHHGDSMIPLPSYCNVSGIPITSLMESQKLNELFEETRRAVGLIVEMAEKSSAYYGPSAVASDLAEVMVRDSRRIIPVSLFFTGQYGIRDVAMSLPAVIGRAGIEKVMEPTLSAEQQGLLEESAATILKVLE